MGELTLRGVEQRWRSEAAFFDRTARVARTTLEPLDRRTLERYGSLRRPHHSKEFRFRLMGDIRGKRILDVGCGDGGNSALMARLGATVVGIDISRTAIEVARERAEIDGVSRHTSFICAPLECCAFDRGEFDIVWGDAFLHHVIDQLDDVVANVVRGTKSGGMAIFAEPLNLARWLRRLRLRISLVELSGTPDERPLEEEELRIIRERIPGLRAQYFQLFGRLNRIILPNHRLESASPVQRASVEALAQLDRLVMQALPPTRRLASSCVLYGRVPR